MGTLSDSMIIIADIMIGYVLYVHLMTKYGNVFRLKGAKAARTVRRKK